MNISEQDIGNALIGVAAFPFLYWGMIAWTFVLDFIASALN